jgi:plasmid stabilization system protein ParE
MGRSQKKSSYEAMKLNVIFRKQANQDLAEAIEWYEVKKVGLGKQFLSAVEACINLISLEPEMFPVVHRNIRKARIKRFPYSIYFNYNQENLFIFAVFHAKRDSRKLTEPNQ